MARFVGNYEHTLDDKGRLILPRAFRSKLEDGAFVTALDHCLAILPTEEFDRMADRLESQVTTGEVSPDAVRAFASEADEVVPDTQGRIPLLPHLRDEVGLDRSVIVTGALRRIEIWDPEAWAARKPEGREKLTAAIERGHGFGPSTD
jgi:MraZ protein